MISDARWKKIEAAWRGGLSLAAICAKFHVPMVDLLMRVAQWKAADAKKNEPPPDPAKLPAVITPLSADARAVHEESTADAIKRHKRQGQALGAMFDELLAEAQQMGRYTASFVDEAVIAELMAKFVAGDRAPYQDHMRAANAALKARTDLQEKLEKCRAVHAQADQIALGIGKDEGGEQQKNYEDLLEELQTPLAPRTLPKGVADFERRLADKKKK